ncbi:MAG: hypothetical protein WC959_11985 [Kiritimatiellales bacterium]
MTTGELKHVQGITGFKFKRGRFRRSGGGFSLSTQNGSTLSSLCFGTDTLESDRNAPLDLQPLYQVKNRFLR